MNSTKLRILMLTRELIIERRAYFICKAIHAACNQLCASEDGHSVSAPEHGFEVLQELENEVLEFLDGEDNVELWLRAGNMSEIDSDAIYNGKVAFIYRLAIIDTLIARHSRKPSTASSNSI